MNVPGVGLSVGRLFKGSRFPFSILVGAYGFSFRSLNTRALRRLGLRSIPVIRNCAVCVSRGS